MPLNHGSSQPSATTTLIQRLKVIMNALHFLFKEEKDEETAFAVSFWNQMVSQSVLYFQDSSTYLGSFPGKQPNIERNYDQIHHFYMMKYFWPRDIARPGCDAKEPQQCESSFERRFRMPRMVFANILEGFLVDSDYIRKGMRPNAVGKLGISPLFKVICALQQISHDIPSDLAIDMFDASETTASLCLDEFCKAVEFLFRTKYLQDPTDEDFIRIERQFARVGFPGCIGCVDCGGWEWQSCPKALQGVMIGKEGKPTLRMELICDLDMWIWAAQFGLPGGFNDLNVREVSTHFNKILAGSLPTVKPSYTVGGIGIDWYYYLADGIYPKWKIFIQTIGQPLTKRKQLFSGRQEAVLKVVERAFGVVFKRFKSLFVKTQNFNVEKIRSMATAAIIMHNMIVVEQNPEAGSTLKVFETSLPMGWCLS